MRARAATPHKQDEARATIKRLNRRCQLAEAAVVTKVEDFMKRSTDGLRNYYYARNRELEQQVAALTHAIEALREELERLKSTKKDR